MFLDVAEKDQSLQRNPKCVRIVQQLKSKEAAKMHFLISVAEVFNLFLVNFQKEEPLIHVLYEKFVSILKKVLGRFIKKEVLDKQRVSDLNLDSVDYKLSDEALEIGEGARKILSDLSVVKRKMFTLGVRIFFKTAVKHLLKKLPLDNGILKKCKVFNPLSRFVDWFSKAIKDLPTDLHVDVNLTRLSDEWRMYQLDKIPDNWYTIAEQPEKHERIDVYWNKVSGIKNDFGVINYPQVIKMVKSALIFAHGNSDVESGFSESGKSITHERVSLGELFINAIRCTSDGIKAFNNDPSAVPITKELLQLGRSAHANYVQRLAELEKKRKKREKIAALLEERKKELAKQSKQRESLEKINQDLERKESEHQ